MLKTDVSKYAAHVDIYPKRHIYMIIDLWQRPVYVKQRGIGIWRMSCVHVCRYISKETCVYEKRPGKETCLCSKHTYQNMRHIQIHIQRDVSIWKETWIRNLSMFKTDVLRYRVRLVYMYVNTYPKRRIYMKRDLEKKPVYVIHKRIETWSTSRVHVCRHMGFNIDRPVSRVCFHIHTSLLICIYIHVQETYLRAFGMSFLQS